MATMSISLPDQMKEWVEAQSADGRYANSSDFVRDLIRKEQIKAEKIAVLQEMVRVGIESGVGTVSVEELREAGKAKARAQHGVNGPAGADTSTPKPFDHLPH
jgi:antitoxin ParD1/3/4